MHRLRQTWIALAAVAAGVIAWLVAGGWGGVPPAGAADPPADGEYGAIMGQFVLDGRIPPRRALVLAGATNIQDPAICAAATIESDELLVDPETQGVANVFVYLPKATRIHPDLKQSEIKEVIFDQQGCRFVPHALVVRTDQVVIVKSNDNCKHNTHGYPTKGAAFNFVVGENDRAGREVRMKVPENLPLTVVCDFHKWMSARWLVLDHPYAAITGATGKFKIDKIPAGEYEFRVWHELPGYIDRKFKIKVAAGQTTDLGTIKLSPDKLADKK